MALLASEAAAGRVSGGGILMLTPCHETPGYSHLHARVPLRILDCSPRSDGDVTQRDAFFAAPAALLPGLLSGFGNGDAATLDGGGVAWAARVGDVPPPVGRPSHIVAFDDVASLLAPMLEAEGYRLKQRFFHAHFAVDRDQRALLVYAEREAGA
jgi:phosphatidylinositol glycan class B